MRNLNSFFMSAHPISPYKDVCKGSGNTYLWKKKCLNEIHFKKCTKLTKDILFVPLSYLTPVHNVSIVMNLYRIGILGFLSLD